MPWGAIVSLVSALVYGVSPVDLIPDVLVVIGWLDDALIVPALLILGWYLYAKWKKGKKAAGPTQRYVDLQVSEPPIPERYERA